MEQIDKLNELQEQYKIASEKFKENQAITADKLSDIITQRCCPEGVELVVNLIMDITWKNDKGRYYFGGEISFKTDDEKRLAKGWVTDFGSNFSIRIYENAGIEINKGTCGSYSRKDKFQVARDLCLAKIWENEEAIINCMTSHFNYDLYKTQFDLYCEISKINADIKAAEEQRKRDEALKALRGAKYLYKHSVNDKYKNDDYWSREKIGVNHHFYDMLVITKITDKTVLCYEENYNWVNKRIPLGSVIYDLQHGILHCSAERPEDYVVLNEEAGE